MQYSGTSRKSERLMQYPPQTRDYGFFGSPVLSGFLKSLTALYHASAGSSCVVVAWKPFTPGNNDTRSQYHVIRSQVTSSRYKSTQEHMGSCVSQETLSSVYSNHIHIKVIRDACEGPPRHEINQVFMHIKAI